MTSASRYHDQIRHQLAQARAKLARIERINAAQMARLGELIDVEDRLHEAEAERDSYREKFGNQMTAAADLVDELAAAQAQHADCHTVTVDGQTIRVHRVGTLGPVSEIALTELIRIARARLAEQHGTQCGPACSKWHTYDARCQLAAAIANARASDAH